MPCSPRMQGWPARGRRLRMGRALLPAHAGLSPAAEVPGEEAQLLLAHAGDGSSSRSSSAQARNCSPRMRGCPRHEPLKMPHCSPRGG
ncbi:hypothetical protein C3489_36490 [Streptomyces sp. Ru71]|nr:hypothetical protein C3489_36490 [Streptomyces sp. Ru71]